MFFWEEFLDARGIAYNASGPNTSAGNIAIRCPFCNRDDDLPEYRYMSIATGGAGWRCFRRPTEHRGRSPVRLIAALLRCTMAEAARIAGVRDLPASLADEVRARLSQRSADASEPEGAGLGWPREFRAFSARATAMPYVAYLADRLEVPAAEAIAIALQLDLRWAASGPYAGRVVFPVRRGGRLLTWTGRAISTSVALRYKTLSTDPEKAAAEGLPRALAPTSDLLLFCDEITARGARRRALVICEGPFDALKLRTLGRGIDLHATCLFGLNLSDAHAAALSEAALSYDSVVLLLDRAALAPALRMGERLRQIGARLRHLPAGVKDPGKLSRSHLDFLQGLLQ